MIRTNHGGPVYVAVLQSNGPGEPGPAASRPLVDGARRHREVISDLTDCHPATAAVNLEGPGEWGPPLRGRHCATSPAEHAATKDAVAIAGRYLERRLAHPRPFASQAGHQELRPHSDGGPVSPADHGVEALLRGGITFSSVGRAAPLLLATRRPIRDDEFLGWRRWRCHTQKARLVQDGESDDQQVHGPSPSPKRLVVLGLVVVMSASATPPALLNTAWPRRGRSDATSSWRLG